MSLFVSLSLAADPERGVDDGPEWSCSGLYIWRCHVRFGGAAKPGDASESQQLSLSRAQAHRVCGLTGLPAQGVGDLTQLPQGLHIAREFDVGTYFGVSLFYFCLKVFLRFT